MNDYEAKQAARRDYFEAKAAKADQQARARFDKALSAIEHIPLGQPILVGHHSEARHRRDLERHDDNMRAGLEELEKAKFYAGKAEGVGRAGISSDDPEAVTKLKAQLERMEAQHHKMTETNRLLRLGKLDEIEALGFTAEQVAELDKGDFMGRRGFASYAIGNSNANMARVKRRIAELSRAPKESNSIERAGYTEHHNTEENRVQLAFDGRPSPEIRDLLKGWGFRWSPKAMVWQRHLNNAGLYAAKQVAEKIATMTKEA